MITKLLPNFYTQKDHTKKMSAGKCENENSKSVKSVAIENFLKPFCKLHILQSVC